MKKRIIIVDKEDNIIGYKERGTLSESDIYRVSALWINNFKGEILLAKRHHTKSHHPNKWGPAVAGTVEEGETYKENIIKEAKEELGLQEIQLTIGPKTETKREYRHFTQWFTLIIDKDINKFRIQESEVKEIKWFSLEELSIRLGEKPDDFLKKMKKYVKLFN